MLIGERACALARRVYSMGYARDATQRFAFNGDDGWKKPRKDRENFRGSSRFISINNTLTTTVHIHTRTHARTHLAHLQREGVSLHHTQHPTQGCSSSRTNNINVPSERSGVPLRARMRLVCSRALSRFIHWIQMFWPHHTLCVCEYTDGCARDRKGPARAQARSPAKCGRTGNDIRTRVQVFARVPVAGKNCDNSQ